ncbi:DUF6864 domain-containing function [Synechococcus elongatus]|uniref:DUF6864 domain-containing function n=1 Tax=Synechococcus elongatus TaxID=32046 RepID=UPI000F7E084C|nr:hypothetical protein [Synechococcus elongatus]
MGVTVGGRELIEAFSLLVPWGDDAWINFAAGDWDVRIRIIFEDDKDDQTPRFDFSGKDDHALLCFKNWNSSLPSAIEKPVPLGQVDGREIVFLFSGYTIGSLKHIDFMFFWEASNVG